MAHFDIELRALYLTISVAVGLGTPDPHHDFIFWKGYPEMSLLLIGKDDIEPGFLCLYD
jgi:hypothetical protein